MDMRYQAQRQPTLYQPQPQMQQQTQQQFQQQQEVFNTSQQGLPRTLPAPSQGQPAAITLTTGPHSSPTSTLPPLGAPFQPTHFPTTNGGGGLDAFPSITASSNQGYSNANYGYRGARDG